MMKFIREFQTFVALLCVYLIHQIDGVPQAGYGWPHRRLNATAGNNNWRQNSTQLPNWQLNNQTVNRNYSYPNNIRNNWQPQGGRLWQNNNQSHPHIQVPGFRSNSPYAAAKQSNLSIPERNGWRQSQPAGPYFNNQTFRNDSGVQTAPTNFGWTAPRNQTGYTNRKGGFSNSTSGSPAQVNNGTNLYPNWHAGLPGSGSGQQGWQWNVSSGHPNATYRAHPYGKLFT